MGRSGECTLLYSHGNAEDIFLSFSFFLHLSRVCRADVLLYEYVGEAYKDIHPISQLYRRNTIIIIYYYYYYYY